MTDTLTPNGLGDGAADVLLRMPFNSGIPGFPHEETGARARFGEQLEQWPDCRATIPADDLDITALERRSVGAPISGARFLCLAKREANSDYCWLHQDGDDRAAVHAAMVRRKRQENAAAARRAKAAKTRNV